MGTRQYVGARYVPKFYDYNGSSNWRSGTEYEALTIVTLNGNSYTSKIPVPSSVGAPDQNPDYWVATGLYNEQVEAYRQLTLALASRVEDAEGDIDSLETATDGLGTRLTTAEGDIDSLETNVTALINNSQRILIVGANSQYTTINSAITDAISIINSIGGRVLIYVLPGTYNEQIVLHPNPGIDFIGYGAKVRGQFSYPNCCAYFSGTTTVIGMVFENNYEHSYALHIEHDENFTSGLLQFIDCEFISMQYHGAGCGMTRGGELLFKNCRFFSAGTVADCAALYLHNAGYQDQATQVVYLINNYFEHSVAIRIDDACRIAGHTNSVMSVRAYGNNASNSKVRFYLTDYDPNNAVKVPEGNILVGGSGNSMIVFNSGHLYAQSLYVPVFTNKYIEFPIAYSKELCEVYYELPDHPSVPHLTITKNGSEGAGPFPSLNAGDVVRVEVVYRPL